MDDNDDIHLSVSEEEEPQPNAKLFFSEFVAMLMQEYDSATHDELLRKFNTKYQRDPLFAQLVWSVCKLDKAKHSYDTLIQNAIPGARVKNIQAPIQRTQNQFKPKVSKFVKKLSKMLVSYNFRQIFDEDQELDETHLEPVNSVPNFNDEEESLHLIKILLD